MPTLDIHGLGVRARVHVTGDHADTLTASLRRAWSRCLTPMPGERSMTDVTLHAEGDLAARMQQFTREFTGRAITAQRGRLLMFHAGAVTAPSTGEAIAFVAPGGTGKTTLATILGRSHGYVTDETVAFTPDGAIVPFPKPLSIRLADRPGIKEETSPDDLGLARAHPDAHLRRLVLIRRAPNAATPTVERLSTADAILELAEESSSLSALPEPLHMLAAFLQARPPVLRIRYAEAVDIIDLVTDALAD